MAMWSQLSSDCVRGLLDDATCYGVQDGFSGEGWPELYAQDMARLAAASATRFTPQTFTVAQKVLADVEFPGGLTPRTKPVTSAADIVEVAGPAVAWIEMDEVATEYPALTDLLERLHALPFELNRRANLKLTEPVTRSTLAARCTEPHSFTPPAVDSGPVGDAADTGYKVTATYFISANWDSARQGGHLGIGQAAGTPAAWAWIEPRADRLVLHRSRQCKRMTSPVSVSASPDSQLWCVTFYLHGGSDEFS